MDYPAAPVVAPEPAAGSAAQALLEEGFDLPDGLITNEFAFWNPHLSSARRSPVWEMTSGSLFARGGRGWTGRVDAETPNEASLNGTNSAVFRLVTRRSDFRDVVVSFDLEPHGCTSTSSTPRTSWDGVHLFLRYQNAQHLYYASVGRCDGRLAIKKKVPGGASNGGTYHTLAEVRSDPTPNGTVTHVRVAIRNRSDGSVQITILRPDGSTALTVVDGGTGGPPITGPGRVGIRGDNAEFSFDDFAVRSAR